MNPLSRVESGVDLKVQPDRPVYRHLVVQRRALVQHIDVSDLRRLRQQMDAGYEVDADLRHLVVKDTLKKSVREALSRAGYSDVPVEASDEGLSDTLFEEARLRSERGDDLPLQYQRQEGVIVGSLVRDQIPGDLSGQAMPSKSQFLHHPGFNSREDRQASFHRSAQELHQQFVAFSDRQFLLLDPPVRAGVTLVTVVLTPIIAVPRADLGVELLCEFYQKTQFGYIDTEGFDVFSEVGDFPVQVPSDADLAMMFVTSEEFKAMEVARLTREAEASKKHGVCYTVEAE